MCRSAVAPAKPITMPATETMPSLAPRTAARSRLSRLLSESRVRLVRVLAHLRELPGAGSVVGEDMTPSS